MAEPGAGSAGRMVWDWPVRLTHWLLVGTVTGSYVTHRLGPDQFKYHRWFGYATLMLVTVRILWGFIGTRHARFAAFVRGPVAVARYLAGFVRGRFEGYAGHNPAGGWIIFLMLALLLAQALTGLFANDEIASTGPLYGYVTSAVSNRLTAWHHRIFDAILIAIALHVVAVLAYLWLKRTNLIGPMVTGRKPAESVAPGEEIPGSRGWLWIGLVAAAGAALAWIIARAPAAGLFVF
ncbi:MAG TPA: cytochrome b/b6 domain-containing protein [Steroidobacteraceae bacterium]|nr:cytochrome b/b6 domain-containing protein [Steroidobacteraceae bacterium]